MKNENASTRFNGMIKEDNLYGVMYPEILENKDRDENNSEDFLYLLKIMFLFHIVLYNY